MSTKHSKAAEKFLQNKEQVAWHNETLWMVRAKRDKMSRELSEWEDLREKACQLKLYSNSHLEELLVDFEENATANGAIVHWAKDAEEYRNIIYDLLRSHGVKRFVKSKSMLSEECELDPFLISKGIDTVETDLGERILQLMHLPPSHVVLPAIHIKVYQSAFPKAKYNGTDHCWIFPSGSKIFFGNMQHTKDRINYQGKRYDFIAFDELTHFTWDEYSYMFSRNRPSGPGTRVYIRATTNPGGIGHGWVKDRFITAAPPLTPIVDNYNVTSPEGKIIKMKRKRIFVPSTVFDNQELLNNDPNYLANLAMMPEAERNALLYGSWDSFDGQVFTEWKNDPTHYLDQRYTHVIEPFDIPAHWKVYRSFDFGYAKPFSVGGYAVDEIGKIYRIKEYYGCNGTPNKGVCMEPTEIAAEIRRIERDDSMLNGRKIIGVADPSIYDESRGESVARMMERAPNFIYWHGGDNTRLAGKMQFHYRFAFSEDGQCMFQDRKSVV